MIFFCALVFVLARPSELLLHIPPLLLTRQDWKLLTIWVGGNNICSVCLGNARDSPAAYEEHLGRALHALRQRIPRVLVNLIPYGPVSRLQALGAQNPMCALVRAFSNECPCAFRARNHTDVERMDAAAVEYNAVLRALAAKYQGDDQFAVVVQPFMEDSHIPDATFLSPFDCFHPSLRAHETMAVHLWNSLFMPAARKPRKLVPHWQPACPHASSRLHTQ